MLKYIFLIFLLSSCAVAEGTQICHITSALNVQTATLWDKTDIKMCWAKGAMDEAYDIHREVVRNIIDKTWHVALSPPEVPEDEWVRFVGWRQCRSGDSHDIKITIAEGTSHVNGLGMDATYVNLNYLNPDKPRWNIEREAIHEFGHLLGLSHEHNSSDTEDQCSYDPQGTDGTHYYGEWDHNSVMNYCNSDFTKSRLSENDAYWIKRVYYPEYYYFECGDLE